MNEESITTVWSDDERSLLCQEVAGILGLPSTSPPLLLGRKIVDSHSLILWSEVVKSLTSKSAEDCCSEFSRLADIDVPHSVVPLIFSHLAEPVEVPVGRHTTNGYLRSLAQQVLGTDDPIHIELRDGEYIGWFRPEADNRAFFVTPLPPTACPILYCTLEDPPHSFDKWSRYCEKAIILRYEPAINLPDERYLVTRDSTFSDIINHVARRVTLTSLIQLRCSFDHHLREKTIPIQKVLPPGTIVYVHSEKSVSTRQKEKEMASKLSYTPTTPNQHPCQSSA